MEDFNAGRSAAVHGMASGFEAHVGDLVDVLPADDPLGDEAAFPSTWQQLASTEFPRGY